MQRSGANDYPSYAGCSFKTIPNSLKQHPFSVTIIHSAITYRVVMIQIFLLKDKIEQIIKVTEKVVPKIITGANNFA